MIKYIQFTRCFLNLIGTRNWYEGIDKPNFIQWIYKWRVSIKTAFKISKIIWID
jgi:hypothetical protein